MPGRFMEEIVQNARGARARGLNEARSPHPFKFAPTSSYTPDMRVIAGSARGRTFEAPKGSATRPTPDRVREALFSILYDSVDDAHVLDIFAGTGALSFEALSRGAKRAVLIESDSATALLVRKNAQSLGFGEETEVLAMSADKAIATLAQRKERFDLVFLDPPYDAGLLEPTLTKLTQAGILSPEALIVAEHRSSSAPPKSPSSFAMKDTRRYGEVALAFYVREKGQQ